MDHFYQSLEGWCSFPRLYTDMVNKYPEVYPEQAHFVEIGSFCGKSASCMGVLILNSGKNIRFDCVDTWQGSPEHDLNTKEEHDKLYNTFLKNIEPIKSVINPIRTTSLEAAKRYKDGSLDFIFIDALHEYEDVKADINAWFPKVKKNGCIAGHDYFDPTDLVNKDLWPGVRQAVDEFFGDKVICLKDEYCWFYHNK